MPPALPAWLPDRAEFVGDLTTAVLVAATLYVVDGSLRYAAAAAGGFLVLQLLTDTAEHAAGDYADNAVFGLLVLGATAAALALTTPPWLVVAGLLVGGWLLVDGVQHLRHDCSRTDAGVLDSRDGSALTAVPKALLARLAEPLLLERRG